MSEMVERVAKAMCEKAGTDWSDTSGNEYAPPLISRPFWMQEARVAIAAMRKPTQGQYDALCATDKMWSEQTSESVWQTYIDASLAEKCG